MSLNGIARSHRKANGGDGKDGQDSAKSDDSSKNAVPFKLRIPTLTLKSGSLTVVAGKVGSGKSSLLAALLGEMTLTTESKSKNAAVVFRGSVAYLFLRTMDPECNAARKCYVWFAV